MATKIVHFGADECARVALLEGMGYSVDICGPSLRKLRDALSQDCDVIAFEGSEPASMDAVLIAREACSAPVVLFEGVARDYNALEFDLVVRSQTPPGDWLQWISELIARKREVQSETRILRARSAEVRDQAKALRKQASAARQEAADLLKAIRNKKD